MFEEDESSALSQKTNIIGLLLELFLKNCVMRGAM